MFLLHQLHLAFMETMVAQGFSSLLSLTSVLILVSIALFVALVGGILYWKIFVPSSRDFKNQFEKRTAGDSTASGKDRPVENLPTYPERSSADTVEIDGDFHPPENERRLNSQATVDATNDASILVDDEQNILDIIGSFSSQPTVDTTGDASVASDDEDEDEI